MSKRAADESSHQGKHSQQLRVSEDQKSARPISAASSVGSKVSHHSGSSSGFSGFSEDDSAETDDAIFGISSASVAAAGKAPQVGGGGSSFLTEIKGYEKESALETSRQRNLEAVKENQDTTLSNILSHYQNNGLSTCRTHSQSTCPDEKLIQPGSACHTAVQNRQGEEFLNALQSDLQSFKSTESNRARECLSEYITTLRAEETQRNIGSGVYIDNHDHLILDTNVYSKKWRNGEMPIPNPSEEPADFLLSRFAPNQDQLYNQAFTSSLQDYGLSSGFGSGTYDFGIGSSGRGYAMTDEEEEEAIQRMMAESRADYLNSQKPGESSGSGGGRGW